MSFRMRNNRPITKTVIPTTVIPTETHELGEKQISGGDKNNRDTLTQFTVENITVIYDKKSGLWKIKRSV